MGDCNAFNGQRAFASKGMACAKVGEYRLEIFGIAYSGWAQLSSVGGMNYVLWGHLRLERAKDKSSTNG